MPVMLCTYAVRLCKALMQIHYKRGLNRNSTSFAAMRKLHEYLLLVTLEAVQGMPLTSPTVTINLK